MITLRIHNVMQILKLGVGCGRAAGLEKEEHSRQASPSPIAFSRGILYASYIKCLTDFVGVSKHLKMATSSATFPSLLPRVADDLWFTLEKKSDDDAALTKEEEEYAASVCCIFFLPSCADRIA